MRVLLTVAPGMPPLDNGLNRKNYEEGEEHRNESEDLCRVMSDVSHEKKGELVESVASQEERNEAEGEPNVLAPPGHSLLTKVTDRALQVRSQRLLHCCPERRLFQYPEEEIEPVSGAFYLARVCVARGDKLDFLFTLRVANRADVVDKAMSNWDVGDAVERHE